MDAALFDRMSAANREPQRSPRRRKRCTAHGKPRRATIARRAVTSLAAAFALFALAGNAGAADWPNAPVRVIVPISAGSALDIIPRIVFEQVSNQLGRPIVIENKPGASGTLGTSFAARAAPDGYTLLAASSAFTIAPSTFPTVGYDPIKDFVGVTTLGNLPNVLVISPSKNIRTVQQLVESAKVRPIMFGSTGVGGPVNLTMERFRRAAGFDATIIPFKGAPEALTEVMAGRIDVYYAPLLAALPFIHNKQVLPLAVSSKKRVTALPDVPTTLEAGYPNSNYNFWVGVFAPTGTPEAVVEKLNAEIEKALEMPGVQDKFEKIGVQPMHMTTKEFAAFVREELATNAELAKAAGIARPSSGGNRR
jgi:tripartite-type tricarboxylate transporter receptor subunit TctC